MQVSDEYVETNHQVIDWVAGLEGFCHVAKIAGIHS